MKELGCQGKVELGSIIQYVIEGIKDKEINKIMLYGALTAKEFNEKLDLYDFVNSKAKKQDLELPTSSIIRLNSINNTKCLISVIRKEMFRIQENKMMKLEVTILGVIIVETMGTNPGIVRKNYKWVQNVLTAMVSVTSLKIVRQIFIIYSFL